MPCALCLSLLPHHVKHRINVKELEGMQDSMIKELRDAKFTLKQLERSPPRLQSNCGSLQSSILSVDATLDEQDVHGVAVEKEPEVKQLQGQLRKLRAELQAVELKRRGF